MEETKMIKFLLDGCDIYFSAKAPEDITLKELLEQCDRIIPDYCACGIKSIRQDYEEIDLIITYDDIEKIGDPPCKIKEKGL